jgi:hypothetical protein
MKCIATGTRETASFSLPPVASIGETENSSLQNWIDGLRPPPAEACVNQSRRGSCLLVHGAGFDSKESVSWPVCSQSSLSLCYAMDDPPAVLSSF